MSRSLRDLLLDAHQLQSDLRDGGLFSAAGLMAAVIEAIRNRHAYDDEREGSDDDTEG